MRVRVAILLAVAARLAHGQPAPPAPSDPAIALREANAEATAGNWARVGQLVVPLLSHQLDRADLAEAHRLAGLVAYFARREPDAELQFVAYLRLELDAHLDPALYPPEVVAFFENVRAKHATELRALRPKPRTSFILNLVPPFGQFQNGERTKGWIIAGAFGAFAIANVTGYLMVRHWCTQVTGPNGSSLVCDQSANHDHSARFAQDAEIAGGVGLLATYIYGVYDGVIGYRRREREQMFMPFAAPVTSGAMLGMAGQF